MVEIFLKSPNVREFPVSYTGFGFAVLFFPNFALVEFCTNGIPIKQGLGVYRKPVKKCREDIS